MNPGAVECSPSDLELLRRQATFFGGEQALWDAGLVTVTVAMRWADVTLPPSGTALAREARAKLMEALASIAAGPTSEESDQSAAC
jgi:hypothetical protein